MKYSSNKQINIYKMMADTTNDDDDESLPHLTLIEQHQSKKLTCKTSLYET